MLTIYESNLLAEHKWMHKSICTIGGEKSNHSFLIADIVLAKYESNLLSEYKWIHEFTQQQVEKTATIHS